MKHVFIVNPRAGKRRSEQLIPLIKKICVQQMLNFEIIITQYTGHATHLAKEIVSKEEIGRIYAIGGDGTINEVLNGMIDSKWILGIIPTGTGNDFFRLVEIVNDGTEKALKEMILGKEERVDVLKVNNFYALTFASVGFDSYVMNQMNRLKNSYNFIPGFMYLVLGIYYALTFKGMTCNIKIDDLNWNEKKIITLVLANGKYYGNGIKIAPIASITDGYFDLCMIEKGYIFLLFKQAIAILRGIHNNNVKGITYLHRRKVEIEMKESFLLNYDGENQLVSRARIEIIPKKLQLITRMKEE